MPEAERLVMKFFLILIALMLSACATEQRVGALTFAAMALSACDVDQTVAVSDAGRWDLRAPSGKLYAELNPLLGATPSPRKLALILAADEVALP